MKIQEAATLIISQWEHGGRYDCHGNGAYGLIGWQGGQLEHLLQSYLEHGGSFAPSNATPKSLADKLLQGDHQSAALNAIANEPLMRQVQQEQARHYMTSAIRHQEQFYPFRSALAQLVLCDMGVNNGVWNNYVKHGGVKSSDDERTAIIKAQEYRIKVVKDAGQWDQYEGIRRRYDWYLEAVKQAPHLRMDRFLPSVKVNGAEVQLCSKDEGIEPLAV